jgi:hypothetical protein
MPLDGEPFARLPAFAGRMVTVSVALLAGWSPLLDGRRDGDRQQGTAAAGSRFTIVRTIHHLWAMDGIQLGYSSSVRAWSIWSYAYVALAVVVIVSPLRARDS